MTRTAEANVRPPIGGWPKRIELEEGESYVKWDGALHARPGYFEQSDYAGTLYLTDRRLFFNPIFLLPLGKTRVWSLAEISAIGNDSRPGLWTRLLGRHWIEWWRRLFYIDAKDERHYFHTTRNEEWLDVLASATGLAPRRRSD